MTRQIILILLLLYFAVITLFFKRFVFNGIKLTSKFFLITLTINFVILWLRFYSSITFPRPFLIFCCFVSFFGFLKLMFLGYSPILLKKVTAKKRSKFLENKWVSKSLHFLLDFYNAFENFLIEKFTLPKFLNFYHTLSVYFKLRSIKEILLFLLFFSLLVFHLFLVDFAKYEIWTSFIIFFLINLTFRIIISFYAFFFVLMKFVIAALHHKKPNLCYEKFFYNFNCWVSLFEKSPLRDFDVNQQTSQFILFYYTWVDMKFYKISLVKLQLSKDLFSYFFSGFFILCSFKQLFVFFDKIIFVVALDFLICLLLITFVFKNLISIFVETSIETEFNLFLKNFQFWLENNPYGYHLRNYVTPFWKTIRREFPSFWFCLFHENNYSFVKKNLGYSFSSYGIFSSSYSSKLLLLKSKYFSLLIYFFTFGLSILSFFLILDGYLLYLNFLDNFSFLKIIFSDCSRIIFLIKLALSNEF